MTRIKFVIAAFVVTSAVHVSAQRPAGGGSVSVKGPTVRATSKLLPGTSPNVLTTIEGSAVDSSNGQLPNALVRLRDARVGRIIESQITDKAGVFSFKGLDPGSYILELMANDSTVLTASQLINVNAGEAVSAFVRLPFRIPALAGVLSNATPSAAALLMTAAVSGVLGTTVSGQPVTPGR
jgi:hypothetical protein